tara:strand:+ start:164003 stop:164656 length:654 start_codon:yes stop_codon:yes gene_type:complete
MKEFELITRESLFPSWILYALIASTTILAVVKLWRPAVFQYITATFVKPPSTIPYSRENLSFFGKASWMLLVNYFVVSGICIYMVELYFGIENIWYLGVPIIYFIFQALSLFLIGGLSGEIKRLNEHFLLLNFTYHSIGLLLIPVLIIWLLNVDFSLYFIYGAASIFGAFWLIRVIRGILFALRNKVLWYYIILYLCSLEIWPLVAIYVLLIADFKG